MTTNTQQIPNQRVLLSFLGLGMRKSDGSFGYSPAHYNYQNQQAAETEWVQVSLLDIYKQQETPFTVMHLLATQKSQDTHQASITEKSAPHLAAADLMISVIKENEFQQCFEVVRTTLLHYCQMPDIAEIVIDVTHGFRTFPIMGMAALAFVNSEMQRLQKTMPIIRVLYGAFEATDRNQTPAMTPIWDLTTIIDAYRWNHALDALMRYGRADDLAEMFRVYGVREGEQVQKALFAQYNTTKMQDLPPDECKRITTIKGAIKMGEAAQEFANDLTTGRLKNLFAMGSAKKLLQFISGENETGKYWREKLPFLQDSLGELSKMIEPLTKVAHNTDILLDYHPTSPAGIGLHALARLYYRLERYMELVSLLREMRMISYNQEQALAKTLEKNRNEALPRNWAAVADFVKNAGGAWKDEDLAIADIRNDVLHLGINGSAKTSQDLRTKLKMWLDALG